MEEPNIPHHCALGMLERGILEHGTCLPPLNKTCLLARPREPRRHIPQERKILNKPFACYHAVSYRVKRCLHHFDIRVVLRGRGDPVDDLEDR